MIKSKTEARVAISQGGPYTVTGNVPLAKQTIITDADGNSQTWEEGDNYPAKETYWLCRCGHSNDKPFCDGTHVKIGFDGTETASRKPYLKEATIFDGSSLILTDAKSLCASGRFCDPNNKVIKSRVPTIPRCARCSFDRLTIARRVDWRARIKRRGHPWNLLCRFRWVSLKIRRKGAVGRSG